MEGGETERMCRVVREIEPTLNRIRVLLGVRQSNGVGAKSGVLRRVGCFFLEIRQAVKRGGHVRFPESRSWVAAERASRMSFVDGAASIVVLFADARHVDETSTLELG